MHELVGFSIENNMLYEALLQLIPGAAAECSKKAAEEIELVFRKLVAEVFGEELPEEGGAAEKHQ